MCKRTVVPARALLLAKSVPSSAHLCVRARLYRSMSLSCRGCLLVVVSLQCIVLDEGAFMRVHGAVALLTFQTPIHGFDLTWGFV